MRSQNAARRNQEVQSEPASGRRIKASRPIVSPEESAKVAREELGLAMTDALQHILEYEHRGA